MAFLPALVAGALFSDFVKRVLYSRPSVIAVAFIAGGIVMLVVERFGPRPIVHERRPDASARRSGSARARRWR